MNTFSVENRTRTYQPRQGVYLRRGPFDDQFDCQLPEEARTELLEEIPSPKTYRLREIPAYQPAPPPPPEVVYRPRAVPISKTPPLEVRRALPAVPRALPVTVPVSTVPDPTIRFYDGTVAQARYQGELPSSAALPSQGRFIGEEWSTGNTSWIWMTPAGASFPSWVDP